eukprot:COSAG02_NODE_54771_length_294_cov_0.794872_2_plen_21_part_01
MPAFRSASPRLEQVRVKVDEE